MWHNYNKIALKQRKISQLIDVKFLFAINLFSLT